MKSCDYCVCWFCQIRKECPEIENRCKNEEQPSYPNATVMKDFECSEATFGEY